MGRIPLIALVLSACCLPAGCGRPAAEVSNVLLVIVDTMRSDHLGCYGYARPTTPHIDSLARSGTRWARVQAQCPWTLPAIATIMTGMGDRTHRAGMWDGAFYGIDPALPFLPHLMNQGGFQTAAFFNVLFLDASFGFNRGFDHFDCIGSAEASNLRDAEATTDAALDWLSTAGDSGTPFLMVVHYYDPHLTYDPPEEYAELFIDHAYDGAFGPSWGSKTDVALVNDDSTGIDSAGVANLVGLYDGEIAFTDDQIGRLLAGLGSCGLSANTLVVVTADHGEEFLDHGGLGHGHTLYQELLSIPLIMSGPGVPQGIVDSTLVGQIDITPTILAFSGLDIPGAMEGMDILAGPGEDRILLSDLLMTTGGRVTARRMDQKLHWVQSSGACAQFDLALDPSESSPLPEVDASLAEAAGYCWATPALGHPSAVDLDEAAARTLRDLGYIR